MSESRTMVPEFLLKNSIVSLIFDKKSRQFDCYTTTTAEAALEAMYGNNVTCLPVYDVDLGKYVGILNLFDVLAVVAFGCFKVDGHIRSDYETSMDSLVSDILGIGEESKSLWAYPPTSRIVELMEPMSKGVHRVLVPLEGPNAVSDTGGGQRGQLARLITQTDVVKYIVNHLYLCDSMVDQTIDYLGLVPDLRDGVHCALESENALASFRRMYTHNVRALPVVDHSGGVVGSVSASDLRRTSRFGLSKLTMPVLEFLADSRRYSTEATSTTPVKPVCCTREITLRDAMVRLVAAGTHQMWVVDSMSSKRPVGVLSYSDIISKFSPFDHKFNLTLK